MLYVYWGTDTQKVHTRASSLVQTLLVRKPEASLYKLEVENVSSAALDELVQSQGLFEKKYIVQLNTLLTDKRTQDILLERLEQIKNSDNIFVVIEQQLTAPLKKKIEKFADKAQEFALPTQGKPFVLADGNVLNTDSFNIFSISDAFGARERGRLWVLLQKALHKNVPVEEVHVNLSWQVRMMLLASQSESAAQAGLKPFVYNKAKAYAKKYSQKELRALSRELVSMHHRVRQGRGELGVALERLILSL